MGSVTALHPAMATGRYLGPATVTGVGDDPVRVELAVPFAAATCTARAALADRGTLAVGEEVLVLGDAGDELYVIGRLSSAPAAPRSEDTVPPAARLPLPGGGYAAVETTNGSTTLRVYSRRNALVVEYDPGVERTRITPEAGDLELAAASGNLALRAAGSVAIEGGVVAVRSRSGIGLAVEDASGATRAVLALDGGRARIAAPALDVAARRASLRAEEARYTGRDLLAEVASLRVVAGRVETLARTVVEKARNLYRSVEELLETRAGRVRAVVDGTYHLKARDAVVRAEREVDVDGEKIRLG
jgi:hypothetical protein